MLTLETTRTLRAVAGTAAAIDYVISCDEVSAGGDSFKVGADGQLPNTITTLYTVPGSGVVSALVNAIDLSNTTGSAVPVTLYVGNPTNRQIFKTTIPANGTVSMTRDGWKVYDSTGLLVLTVPLGSATPQPLSAGAGSAGTSTTAARDDHQHQHGDLSASSATMHSKASVGLANVDNTSDVNKPVSTAQAAADTAATAAAQATSLQKASNLSDLANAGTARTNLGLGTAATQPTSAFDAAGAAAAAQAASQPLDSDLTDIAAETATTDNVLQSVASHWKSRTPAQLKATLALVKGDVGLGNVDNTSDVNKPVSTAQAAADSAVLALSLQKASNLSDLANAGTARTNLGLGSAATQPSTAFDAAGAAAAAQAASQPLDATLTALAGQNWATDTIPVGTGADTVTQLALAAGTIPGKSSAGAVAAKTVSDAGFAFLAAANVAAETALLNPATTLLKGLMSATDKLKVDDLWLDVTANSIATLVGDDSTLNDTAMASIIAGAPSGTTIFFPPGTYRFAAEININVDHRLKFQGSGKYTSIIKTTSATANIFHVSVTAWYMSWADLGFQTSVNKTAGACLLVDAGSNIAMNVYRCAFGDNPAATIFQGINFTGAQSGNVSVLFDLEMSGFSNGGRGIFINGSTINLQIHQTTINLGATTTSACLEIQQSGAVQVTNFDWIQGTNVILFNSTAGAGPQACYFTNGFCDQPSGSVIKFMGGNTANRIKFTAVGIAPTGNNHAIEIAGTGAGAVGTTTALPGGISIVDCDIYSSNGTNTGAGIFVNGCQDINIQSCRVTGFGGAGGAGVRIAGSSSNQTKVRINGCIFGPNSNLTVNNTTHVDIQAGSSGLGALSVSDNQMDGATTAPLADASAAVLGVNKRFSQNSGLMAGAGTQQLLSSGGAAVIAGRGAVTSGTTDTFLFTSKIPANSVQVGQKFRMKVVVQFSGAGVPTLTLRAGAAGTLAGDTAICAMVTTAQVANGYVTADMIVEVVALGPTATVVGHGSGDGGNAAVATSASLFQTAAAEVIPNVPTTAAWFITLTGTCGTAGTMTVKDAVLEAL